MSGFVTLFQDFLDEDKYCESVESLEPETLTSLTGSLIFLLVAASFVFTHLMHKARFITEGGVACLLGTGSALMMLTAFAHCGVKAPAKLFRFKPELFFDLMLPPIIFNAGYTLRKRFFFRNIATIMTYGFFGTLMSFSIITAGAAFTFTQGSSTNYGLDLTFEDCLALGAILSSTDSVAALQVLDQDTSPMLYSIVFGEGVLNDATSVVLLRSVHSLSTMHTTAELGKVASNFGNLFMSSLAVGVVCGVANAFTTRRLFAREHSAEREVALILATAFLAYSLAEALSLSGVFSIFFCAIIQSHYTVYSMSPDAQVVAKYVSSIVSFVCETFIFVYVGWTTMDYSLWQKTDVQESLGLFFMLFTLLIVSRTLVVVPLSIVSNLWRNKDSKITVRDIVVIWWAGTMRGAIASALAFKHFSNARGSTVRETDASVISTSLVLVMFSTLAMGSITKPFLGMLIPKLSEEGTADASSGGGGGGAPSEPLLTPRSAARPPLADSRVHYWWRLLDDRYIQPVLGGKTQASASAGMAPEPEPEEEDAEELPHPPA